MIKTREEEEDDFGEEEIIDGFAILTFKYLKDLKVFERKIIKLFLKIKNIFFFFF